MLTIVPVSGDYGDEILGEHSRSRRTLQLGVWRGKGAELLGLRGPVVREQFLKLLKGLPLNGNTRLAGDVMDPQRQSGWELTFSAPKSVSVLWTLAPEDSGKKIEMMHRVGVEHARDFLEKAIAGCLNNHEPDQRVNLIFTALHRNLSARNDPELCTRLVLANVAVSREGSTSPLEGTQLFGHRKLADSYYQVHVREELRRELNLATEREPGGFHVVGVPKVLCRELSRGHFNGVDPGTGTHVSGIKSGSPAKSGLFEAWQKMGETLGWGRNEAAALIIRASDDWGSLLERNKGKQHDSGASREHISSTSNEPTNGRSRDKSLLNSNNHEIEHSH